MKTKRKRLPLAVEKEPVDMIASGYEWICPSCGKLNTEIEYMETVTCGVSPCEQFRYEDTLDLIVKTAGITTEQARKYFFIPQGCGAEFETNPPEHAL